MKMSRMKNKFDVLVSLVEIFVVFYLLHDFTIRVFGMISWLKYFFAFHHNDNEIYIQQHTVKMKLVYTVDPTLLQ